MISHFLLQQNGMESLTFKSSPAGRKTSSITDYADEYQADAFDACCYCQWDGPPAALTKSYFVSIDGKNTNSVRLHLLALAIVNDSLL